MKRTSRVSTARLIQRRDFLRRLSAAMNRLPDPRRQEQCVYSQAHLLWTGIPLFMMHLGSRRQLRLERLTEAFVDNLTMPGQIRFSLSADPQSQQPP